MSPLPCDVVVRIVKVCRYFVVVVVVVVAAAAVVVVVVVVVVIPLKVRSPNR